MYRESRYQKRKKSKSKEIKEKKDLPPCFCKIKEKSKVIVKTLVLSFQRKYPFLKPIALKCGLKTSKNTLCVNFFVLVSRELGLEAVAGV